MIIMITENRKEIRNIFEVIIISLYYSLHSSFGRDYWSSAVIMSSEGQEPERNPLKKTKGKW